MRNTAGVEDGHDPIRSSYNAHLPLTNYRLSQTPKYPGIP